MSGDSHGGAENVFNEGLSWSYDPTDYSNNNFSPTTTGTITIASTSPYGSDYKSQTFGGTTTTAITYSGSASAVNYGTGDFTVEAWVNFSSTSGKQVIASQWGAAGNRGWELYFSSGQLIFDDSTNGTAVASSLVYNFAPTIGTWYFITVDRVSGVLYMYINGVVKTSAANTDSFYASTQNFVIGNEGNSGTVSFKGQLSEIRATSVDRYGGTNFSPPTTPLGGPRTPKARITKLLSEIFYTKTVTARATILALEAWKTEPARAGRVTYLAAEVWRVT